MSDVIHVGSVGFTLISLLGIHCLAISVRCSVTFSVYLLISSFLKLSQSGLYALPSINHSCLVHKSKCDDKTLDALVLKSSKFRTPDNDTECFVIRRMNIYSSLLQLTPG